MRLLLQGGDVAGVRGGRGGGACSVGVGWLLCSGRGGFAPRVRWLLHIQCRRGVYQVGTEK